MPAGLIFGALASATAPAATVDVLHEYRSRGSLTSTIFAVVGIDDAIALIIYGFGSSIAKMLLSVEPGTSFIPMTLRPIWEILGSIFLGGLGGMLYGFGIRSIRGKAELLVLSAGSIFVLCGLSEFFHLSLILTNMTFGIVATNISPFSTRRTKDVVDHFTPPLYTLFFILVGSRFQVANLPKMGLVGIAYILARSIGKYAGTLFGATISGAEEKIRKYLGLALLSQAGVAIGLAIAASQDLSTIGGDGIELGQLIIDVITATTFVVQIIGPPMVKFAIVRAGETDQLRVRLKKGKQ